MEQCWWLATAGEDGDGRDAAPLVGERRADVCVVGGGYLGLWTALRLREERPELEVALVERHRCGDGASGRNAGFALTLWHHVGGLEAVCGAEEALRLCHESERAVGEIERFCADHAIAADVRRRGWLWAAGNEAQRDAWASTVAVAARHGQTPFAALPDAEAATRTGSPRYVAAVHEAVAATLQPAALARGLRRVAIERGVRIHERTPMTRLDRDGAGPVVVTPRGRIAAGRVVLCLNAWTVGLPGLGRALAVVGSDVVVSEPATAALDAAGIPTGLAVSDSRLMVEYHRRTVDDRLVFGKGGLALGRGARPPRPDPRRAALVGERLRRTYPQLAALPLAAAWSGPIDRTVDGLPFFTTLAPGVLCGAGFSGNGVVTTLLGARILTALALDRDDDWSRSGLVRRPPRGMPPEPLRWAAGQLVRGAVGRKEAREDAGRPVAPLLRRLAGLAPTGLVPSA
ncbi:NAD(P)/FAD-dependent oxidoreductase [Patulibacter defluvii]|uniref:NAD(P)/FAD-dependent oxidoreductase n=1 Tax=Patulibacter defluvii TaxID=3095358 RepID=UPI002A74DBCB|nr:FAD-binding oxidoreductase [Patulibacter sp. DM4]